MAHMLVTGARTFCTHVVCLLPTYLPTCLPACSYAHLCENDTHVLCAWHTRLVRMTRTSCVCSTCVRIFVTHRICMHEAPVLCSTARTSCARGVHVRIRSACVSCACGSYLVRFSPTCACIGHVSCSHLFHAYAPTVACGNPEWLMLAIGVLVLFPLTFSPPTKGCSDGW